MTRRPTSENALNNTCLLQLQRWYQKQCNGIWEKAFGIRIDTLDNPGWSIEIDLQNTILESREFNTSNSDFTEHEWVHCWVKSERVFHGAGGPENLQDLIRTFLLWENECDPAFPLLLFDKDLTKLQKWYHSQCNGDWEHVYGIRIESTAKPGWHLSIDLEGTDLEGAAFIKVVSNDNDLDWYVCLKKGNKFEALCGPRNLAQVLHIFNEWIEGCGEEKES